MACFNAGSLPYCSDILTLPRSCSLRQCKNGWLLLSCAQSPLLAFAGWASCARRVSGVAACCFRKMQADPQQENSEVGFLPSLAFHLQDWTEKVLAHRDWLAGWGNEFVECVESLALGDHCPIFELIRETDGAGRTVVFLHFVASQLRAKFLLVCVAEKTKLYIMQVSKQHATSGEIHTVWPCCWYAMSFGVLSIWQRWQCCFLPSTEAALAVRRSRARMHDMCGAFVGVFIWNPVSIEVFQPQLGVTCANNFALRFHLALLRWAGIYSNGKWRLSPFCPGMFDHCSLQWPLVTEMPRKDYDRSTLCMRWPSSLPASLLSYSLRSQEALPAKGLISVGKP